MRISSERVQATKWQSFRSVIITTEYKLISLVSGITQLFMLNQNREFCILPRTSQPILCDQGKSTATHPIVFLTDWAGIGYFDPQTLLEGNRSKRLKSIFRGANVEAQMSQIASVRGANVAGANVVVRFNSEQRTSNTKTSVTC